MDLVNFEHIAVADWFKASRPSLNGLTRILFFFALIGNQYLIKNLVMSIDNAAISQIKFSQFLGVYVDEHLTENSTFGTIISTKIAKNVGILSRMSYLFPCKIFISSKYSSSYLSIFGLLVNCLGFDLAFPPEETIIVLGSRLRVSSQVAI